MYNIRIINSIIQLVNVINYQLHICASIALTICKYFLCVLFIDLVYDHQGQHYTYLYSTVIKKSRF